VTDETKRAGLCRRQLLQGGLTGTLAGTMALSGLAVRPARAQDFPKATQEAAGYQDHVTSQTCSECTLFLPPDQCKVVQGPISEMGTCIYFTQ
jgi:hypothetical protein